MVSIVENQQKTLEVIKKDDVKETPPSKSSSPSPPAHQIVLGDLLAISDHSRGHDPADRTESDCSVDMKVQKSVTEEHDDLPPLIGGGDMKEPCEEGLNQDSATSAETLFLLDVSDEESEGPDADSLLARRSSHRRLGEKGLADDSENRVSSESDSCPSSSDDDEDSSSDDDSSNENEESNEESSATVSEEQLYTMAQAFLRSVVQCQAIFRRYRVKQQYRQNLDAVRVLQLWARPIAQKVRRKRRREERQAAIRIQTVVRGFMARLAFDELLEYLEEQLSALVIQSWWRECSIGSHAEHEAAMRIQAAFRGWAATEFFMLQGFAVSLIQSNIRGHQVRQKYKCRKPMELNNVRSEVRSKWEPTIEDDVLPDSGGIPSSEEPSMPRESRAVISPVDTIASSSDSYSTEIPPTGTDELDGDADKANSLYRSTIEHPSSDDSLPPSPTKTEVDAEDYYDEPVVENEDCDRPAHAPFTTAVIFAILCLVLPMLLSVDGFTHKFDVPSATYEPILRTFSNMMSSFTPSAIPEQIKESDKKRASKPVPSVQKTPRVEPSLRTVKKPYRTTRRKRMQHPPRVMETAPTASFHVPSAGLFFGKRIGEREKILSKAVSRTDKSPVFGWAKQLRARIFETTTVLPTKLELTGWLEMDGRGLFASRLNAENGPKKVKNLTRSKAPLVEEASLKVAKDANLSLLTEWGLVLMPRHKRKSA